MECRKVQDTKKDTNFGRTIGNKYDRKRGSMSSKEDQFALTERLSAVEAFRRILEASHAGSYPHIRLLTAYRVNAGYMLFANPLPSSNTYTLFFFSEKSH